MSQYQISHTISYQYDRPVIFSGHLLRLRPRGDSFQQLQQFSLSINPAPIQLYDSLDFDGNTVTTAVFEQVPTSNLTIHTLSQVETCLVNPFNYLLTPWALQLPIDYPTTLWQQLQPYLWGYLARSAAIHPVAAQLGQEIWLATNGQTLDFLTLLNQRIHDNCRYLFRETGDPLPPGITWGQQGGSCRDLAVLFMEVCRSIGLAARFVSGYQESSAEMIVDELMPPDHQHLHAWAEIYLPGAGWRGYDPTHGLAVADDHIALVASAWPQQSAPTTGAIQGGAAAQSIMSYQLTIQKTAQKSVALVLG
jgi:transglutaminase-like putative cysteine protease